MDLLENAVISAPCKYLIVNFLKRQIKLTQCCQANMAQNSI